MKLMCVSRVQLASMLVRLLQCSVDVVGVMHSATSPVATRSRRCILHLAECDGIMTQHVTRVVLSSRVWHNVESWPWKKTGTNINFTGNSAHKSGVNFWALFASVANMREPGNRSQNPGFFCPSIGGRGLCKSARGRAAFFIEF
jgi:hypothetical protein